MFLSDEQTAAATHGLRSGEATFEWVDLPVGPQPIPDWARGLEVRWLDGYLGRPGYTVKIPSDFDARGWPDKVFRREGPRYLAESGDGRAECYYHSGEPQLTELKQRQICYPVSRPGLDGRTGVLRYAGQKYHDRLDGRWWCSQGKPSGILWFSTYVGWATFQDEGFGGDNIPVKLDDGRWVMLRGPWHGASPPGYVDVGTSRCGCVYLSEDLLVLLIARYQPHCRAARVTQYGRTWVEAVRPDWDEPKTVRESRR